LLPEASLHRAIGTREGASTKGVAVVAEEKTIDSKRDFGAHFERYAFFRILGIDPILEFGLAHQPLRKMFESSANWF
jgi:hypothetical protein